MPDRRLHGALLPHFLHCRYHRIRTMPGSPTPSNWPNALMPQKRTASSQAWLKPAANAPRRKSALLTMMVYLHSEVFAKPDGPSQFTTGVLRGCGRSLARRDRELARDDGTIDLRRRRTSVPHCNEFALTLQQTPQDQPAAVRLIVSADGHREAVATKPQLREQDVPPLIKEIVDRSQLLVELDQQSFPLHFSATSRCRNSPRLANYGTTRHSDGGAIARITMDGGRRYGCGAG